MTYLLENINTTIAKIAECMARDPKRAERLLGDVKADTAKLEQEAYARGRAAGLELAARTVHSKLYPSNPVSDWTGVAHDHAYMAAQAQNAIRALIPEQ